MTARSLLPALAVVALLAAPARAALSLPGATGSGAARGIALAPEYPAPLMASLLALPVGQRGLVVGPLLAQRAIDREWGRSDDSTYREVNVPGWKSEGLALGLSAALPGTGQLYSGESSGWLYLVAESAGWMGRWLERRAASRRYADLAGFVGDPSDSGSGFSFARYAARTGSTADELVTLWSGDRNAYYRALAADPGYTPGFSGAAPSNTYEHFSNLLSGHDTALHRATLIESALVIHHIAAAIDAIRAARLHDLPLREEYKLEIGEGWSHGRPELRAAVVRRF